MKSNFYILVVLILAQLISSCVYRFTNTRIALPSNLKKISIEAVYDTSREVVPHEILWQELQRAFAADGRLIITSADQADAIVLTHLTNADAAPSGGNTLIGPRFDPSTFPAKPKSLGEIDQLRNMRRAGETSAKEILSVGATIEIIDLRTRKVLFNKSYPVSDTYKIAISEDQASKGTHFLRYHEAREVRFKAISQQIAQRVVHEFVSGL